MVLHCLLIQRNETYQKGFQASAAKQIGTALFRAITRRAVLSFLSLYFLINILFP